MAGTYTVTTWDDLLSKCGDDGSTINCKFTEDIDLGKLYPDGLSGISLGRSTKIDFGGATIKNGTVSRLFLIQYSNGHDNVIRNLNVVDVYVTDCLFYHKTVSNDSDDKYYDVNVRCFLANSSAKVFYLHGSNNVYMYRISITMMGLGMLFNRDYGSLNYNAYFYDCNIHYYNVLAAKAYYGTYGSGATYNVYSVDNRSADIPAAYPYFTRCTFHGTVLQPVGFTDLDIIEFGKFYRFVTCMVDIEGVTRFAPYSTSSTVIANSTTIPTVNSPAIGLNDEEYHDPATLLANGIPAVNAAEWWVE